MFRTLVKTEAIAIEDHTYPVQYFESRTARGARRYSAEILIGPGDHIILDDDSVTNLEAKTTQLVPATVYSRLLAERGVDCRGVEIRKACEQSPQEEAQRPTLDAAALLSTGCL